MVYPATGFEQRLKGSKTLLSPTGIQDFDRDISEMDIMKDKF